MALQVFLMVGALLFCRYQGGRSYKSFLEFLQKQLENDKVGRSWAPVSDDWTVRCWKLCCALYQVHLSDNSMLLSMQA